MSSAVEVSAAKAAAAKAGLGEVEPHVLRAAEHISLRLAPFPIVARILRGSAAEKTVGLIRELDVARHLASVGAPTVRPAREVEPGPYFENDCAITLWNFVEGRPVSSDADVREAARALRTVHAALEPIAGHLPPLTKSLDSCEAILSDGNKTPDLPPDDSAFLRKVFESLRRELDGRSLVHRPLHGDAHMENAFVTRSGVIWMDLEAVCTGPLEWDLASMPASARAEFEGFAETTMRVVHDLRSLCVATWCWAQLNRDAKVREAAVYHLGRLKARFR